MELLKLYDIIYADPPWRYDAPNAIAPRRGATLSNQETRNIAIDTRYDTMSLDELKKLEIPCKKDAILFLWAVSALLPEALYIMKAWGFKYKSNMVWDKVQVTWGFWFQNQHELLLLGIKGKIKCPDFKNRYKSLLTSKKRTHSRKPDEIRMMIEKMFPGRSKIELFARQRFEGWNAHGNEAPRLIQRKLDKIIGV